MSLANKYRPKTFEDVTEQKVIVDMLEAQCKSSELSCKNFLLIGPAGCGKANTLDTDILTVHGYVKMRDIKLGDQVFTHTGAVGKVSGIFPQGERPVYRITLQDKSYIDVSDEHLNLVHRYNQDKQCREDFCITTRDLIELFEKSEFKLRVDIPEVDWIHKNTAVDPYLLGILICRNASNLDDMYSWDNGLLLEEFQSIDGIHDSKIVSIPKNYLYTDKDARIRLMQGLIDASSSFNEDGSIIWKTSCKQISRDFEFLIRSLGILDTVEVSFANSMNVGKSVKSGVCVYNHHLEIPNTLSYDSYTNCNLPTRNIVSIEYLGNKECQCIMVDHPDHSYICNRGMIPTHNTTLGRIMANTLNEGKGQPIELDAASHGSIDEVRNLIEQSKQYPIGQKYKVIIADESHSFSNAAWQTLLKTLEDGSGKSVWIFCTTNPEKIPATILSRVQTFQLSKISLQGIYDRLKYVVECENKEGANITYEDDALNYIAKLANGGMRDSLTLLDKALAYSHNLTSVNIIQALNLPKYDDFFNLLQSYAKKDNEKIASIIDSVYNSGINFVKWMESFHSFIMQIVKYILLQDINKTMIPTIYADKISKYSSKHLIICLNLSHKLLTMNQELKTTSYLQEVALTYLCFIPKGGTN